jgi:di- and tripeptidase
VVADWWLGDTEDRFFKAAESAIEQEWGQKPLFIREGGSVPAIRWLEKRLQAAAVHIPMGQVIANDVVRITAQSKELCA